jgi:sulfite reductase (NADPH) hemoprotein beta-component
MTTEKLTEVEAIKAKSDFLRGTLRESLNNPLTGAIAPDDTHVVKFHGSYQQDDRDMREERRLQRLEPDYQFMVRTRLPGGVCTPAQWLALDAIATTFANQTLRITTRQAFQLHGIVKGELSSTMQALNQTLIDTVAACGDVNRNVMCNPNPVESAAHQTVYRWAVKLSEHLLPKTRAWYEIFLGEERVAGGESEPLYGKTYLPRKFKAAIAVPPINDVDIYTQDLGFIAVIQNQTLSGFNVTVGGGMGATHGDNATYPRLADTIGFVEPEQMLQVAETVLAIQRDFGDRTNRKHARLKYTIADRGIDWFTAELHRRLGFALTAPIPITFEHNGDRLGWIQGADEKFNVTLHLDAGRVADTAVAQQLTGLREIARIHTGDFRLTPNQNLTIAQVAPEQKADIDTLLKRHGLDAFRTASPMKQRALACVALPTCALAMAEAERYLPAFTARFERLLDEYKLRSQPVNVRITGCPNGCARPYVAEVALVGKAPGRYNLMLGGNQAGARLAKLHTENADEAQLFETLKTIVARYAAERNVAESLGDFVWRSGVVK